MSRRPWTQRVVRRIGVVFGPVPGWYMVLVEPWARGTSGEVVADSIGGAPMQLELSEFVQRKHYFHAFERRELRFIRRHVRPGDCCVDVGANVGVLAVEAARAVGNDGIVLAIEPVPSNIARLRHNAALQGSQIRVVETAVGAKSDVLRLGLTAQQRSAANMGSYRSGVDDPEGVVVPVRRLDDVLADELNDQQPVRLLKLDVEGMEGDVVRGAEQGLSSGRIDLVMFEKNPTLGNETPEELLRSHGYEIHRLGLGGRLRRPSKTTPNPPRPRSATTGTLSAIVAWVRGDARLTTLIAVRR